MGVNFREAETTCFLIMSKNLVWNEVNAVMMLF